MAFPLDGTATGHKISAERDPMLGSFWTIGQFGSSRID
jgi:hypothetical protein